ncbi:MAG: hypothetical protein ACOYYS_17030 [Chloroflexota bacterium]
MSPSVNHGRLVADGPHMTARLSLYDAHLRLIERAVGQIDLKLEPGLYRVEAALADGWDEKFIRIEAGSSTHIERYDWQPGIRADTAAPVAHEFSRTTHESHLYPARELSTHITDAHQQGNSRLFVFIRTATETATPLPLPIEGLCLVRWDRLRTPITRFQEGIQADPGSGFLAYTADLEPGPYLLACRVWDGTARPWRCQPLNLCANFETQVFIPWRDGLELAGLTLNMAYKGRGFNPSDESALAVETVLRGIYHGENLASSQQMRSLLNGKFADPWLGILAAHALLLDSKDDSRWLYDIVLRNLRDVVGLPEDFPDVAALLLRADRAAARPMDTPPMLSAGLRRAQHHDADHPETLLDGSLAESILGHLIGDSAWTAWHAGTEALSPKVKSLGHKGINEAAGVPCVDAEAVEWMEEKASQANFEAWLHSLPIADLSRTFGISRAQLERFFNDWEAGIAAPRLDSTPVMQPLVHYLRDRERYTARRAKTGRR